LCILLRIRFVPFLFLSFIYTPRPLRTPNYLGLLRLLHQPRPPPHKSTHHPLLNFEEEEEENDQDMDDTSDELSSYGTCIVCQEDLNEPKAFGSLGLVQPSRLLRKHPDSHSQYLNELMTMPQLLDRASPHDTTFPSANAEELDTTSSPNFDGFPTQYTRFGLHASACGHMMHLNCFQVYNPSILHEWHRSHATRNHPENIQRKEYICPLCESLGNVLLPVLHPNNAPASQTPFPD
jgi:E3 ubiquitin-protein ligase UBR1